MNARSISVVLRNYALDMIKGPDNKERLVVRGVLDVNSLTQLQIGAYQREALPESSDGSLVDAVESGLVPDIELGMRGARTIEEGSSRLLLVDPVFIIDGLQRVVAARALLAKNPLATCQLGATVYFETDEQWERERFQILNAERVRLAPNVLLRNLRHDCPSIAMLYGLTTEDRSSLLFQRVGWAQRTPSSALITAMVLAKTVGALHSHLGSGRATRFSEVARGLDGIQAKIGEKVMRANTLALFELLDEGWGVRRVASNRGATWLKGAFLWALATFLSNHTDFWRAGNRLFVEAPLRKKIAQFPIDDPEVQRLSSSGGTAREMLLYLLTKHVNSGKRTKRLTPRESPYDVASAGDAPGE